MYFFQNFSPADEATEEYEGDDKEVKQAASSRQKNQEQIDKEKVSLDVYIYIYIYINPKLAYFRQTFPFFTVLQLAV